MDPKALPPGTSIFGPSLHSSDTSFPIIAIAIIGILATAFLLVSYYIFVIKCCLNWHRIDILRRFSLSRRRQTELLVVYAPAMETRGLDEAVIRSIPIFQFKKRERTEGNSRDFGTRSFSECAVCLNEFQEYEKLRKIPNCSHVFHIDCIDVWLQNNANCPLCRTSISTTTRFSPDQITAPNSSPRDPNPVIGGDDDFVVIELGSNNSTDQTLFAAQERLNSNSRELLPTRSISPLSSRMKKLHKVTSMGDECIDMRGKDEQFCIQPIRRSFSMDSSTDRQLYLAVQQAIQQKRQASEVSPLEGCSSRVKRSLFSFGHGRGSRSAVLPVHLEP